MVDNFLFFFGGRGHPVASADHKESKEVTRSPNSQEKAQGSPAQPIKASWKTEIGLSVRHQMGSLGLVKDPMRAAFSVLDQ